MITNLLNRTGNILIYGLIALVVIFCLVLLLKFKPTRKFTLYALSIIIIFSGGFCSYLTYDILNTHSQEIGHAYHIEYVEDYTIISEFQYGYIDFESEDNINYKNISSYKAQEFNGTDKDYVVLINNLPADYNEVLPGKVLATINLNFYDVNGNVTATIKIDINIEYLSKETSVKINAQNKNNSISYLSTYMEINGVDIKVIARS